MSSRKVELTLDLSQTGPSSSIQLGDFNYGSIDILVGAGDANGQFKIQKSTDGQNWNDLTLDTPLPANTGADYFETVELVDFAPPLARVYYTRASGSGTAHITASVKGA